MYRFITNQECWSCKQPSFIRWRVHNDLVIAVTLHYACILCGNHGEVTVTKTEFQDLVNCRLKDIKEVDRG